MADSRLGRDRRVSLRDFALVLKGTFLLAVVVPFMLTAIYVPLPVRGQPPRTVDRAHRCGTYRTMISLAVPGCGNVNVWTHACRGQCRSTSFPEWQPETQSLRMVGYCYCCKPMGKVIIRGLVVDCPLRAAPAYVSVTATRDCRCRPCSDGNPDAQQPYDY